MAEEKRKQNDKLTVIEGEKKKLQTSYQDLLANKNLTADERDGLQTRLEDVEASLRSKDQQAEFDRKKAEEAHTTELKTATERADHWEQMFKTETVNRALLDAASGVDAFNPNHIVALLRPNTKLKEVEGVLTPMVDFPDIDEKTGDPTTTMRTPADAVKRMQQLPKEHGCLFRSNVVAGVGSGQATVSNAGDLDVASMTAADYRKNRTAIKERMANNQ